MGIACLCVGLAASLAQAVTIDFEGLGIPMPNADGQPVPAAAQLGSQYQATQGAVFSSGSGYAALVELGAGHATTGSVGIGGTAAGGTLSYVAPIEVRFFLPGTSTPAVTDSVSLRLDLFPLESGTVTMQAFDVSLLSLGSVTVTDATNPAPLVLNIPGIHRIAVSETSGTVAFDDLTFNTLTEARLPAVPALSGSGLAALLLLIALAAAYALRGSIRA